ncbi:hypothetical protein BC828DRAFT_375098 [Blastocladiella britannica]|nr:hypothetical protein BC828DRAFT_375098 [Blastocladiella britannica]
MAPMLDLDVATAAIRGKWAIPRAPVAPITDIQVAMKLQFSLLDAGLDYVSALPTRVEKCAGFVSFRPQLMATYQAIRASTWDAREQEAALAVLAHAAQRAVDLLIDIVVQTANEQPFFTEAPHMVFDVKDQPTGIKDVLSVSRLCCVHPYLDQQQAVRYLTPVIGWLDQIGIHPQTAKIELPIERGQERGVYAGAWFPYLASVCAIATIVHGAGQTMQLEDVPPLQLYCRMAPEEYSFSSLFKDGTTVADMQVDSYDQLSTMLGHAYFVDAQSLCQQFRDSRVVFLNQPSLRGMISLLAWYMRKKHQGSQPTSMLIQWDADNIDGTDKVINDLSYPWFELHLHGLASSRKEWLRRNHLNGRHTMFHTCPRAVPESADYEALYALVINYHIFKERPLLLVSHDRSFFVMAASFQEELGQTGIRTRAGDTTWSVLASVLKHIDLNTAALHLGVDREVLEAPVRGGPPHDGWAYNVRYPEELAVWLPWITACATRGDQETMRQWRGVRGPPLRMRMGIDVDI